MKFHIAPTLTTNPIFRVSCVTDIDGLLYDVLHGDVDGDFWLANDFWRNPEDFGLDAAWEGYATGETVQFKGKERRVFTMENIMWRKWVVLEKPGSHYTYARLSKEKSPARFVFGDISEVEYH